MCVHAHVSLSEQRGGGVEDVHACVGRGWRHMCMCKRGCVLGCRNMGDVCRERKGRGCVEKTGYGLMSKRMGSVYLKGGGGRILSIVWV